VYHDVVVVTVKIIITFMMILFVLKKCQNSASGGHFNNARKFALKNITERFLLYNEYIETFTVYLITSAM
jgi:hypothetical protein